MNKTLVISAPLMIAVLATPLWADNDSGWRAWGWRNGPGMMNRMGAIDTNDDGVISDDEAADQVESIFTMMDEDEDGELTTDEFMSVRMGPRFGRHEMRQKMMQEHKKARFAEIDADKNGKISKVEFIAAGKARFEAADICDLADDLTFKKDFKLIDSSLSQVLGFVISHTVGQIPNDRNPAKS